MSTQQQGDAVLAKMLGPTAYRALENTVEPSERADSEPAPEDVARWQAELSRDMTAADRGPVGVTVGSVRPPLRGLQGWHRVADAEPASRAGSV